MISGEIKLTGFKELNDLLLQLPDAVGGKVLSKATYEAATVIREDAQARAPERTGRLRQFIGRGRGRSKSDDRYEAVVLVGLLSLSGKEKQNYREGKTRVLFDAFYGKFIEFGTRFMGAQPFLRPAFDSKKEDFIRELGNELGKRIDEKWDSSMRGNRR